MALKDWKKSKSNLEWYNAWNEHTLYIDNIVYSKTMDKGVQVEIKDDDGNIIKEKHFKTKLQALKFAKEYMIKH
jgi:hypothetical protein